MWLMFSFSNGWGEGRILVLITPYLPLLFQWNRRVGKGKVRWGEGWLLYIETNQEHLVLEKGVSVFVSRQAKLALLPNHKPPFRVLSSLSFVTSGIILPSGMCSIYSKSLVFVISANDANLRWRGTQKSGKKGTTAIFLLVYFLEGFHGVVSLVAGKNKETTVFSLTAV